MSLDSGKHTIKEIEGVRCTVVETGVSEDRVKFLKHILEHNGLTVKSDKEPKKDETAPDKYIIGVTDIVFNPVIAVYERKLRTPDGKVVTPQYWRQISEDSKQWYWKVHYDQDHK